MRGEDDDRVFNFAVEMGFEEFESRDAGHFEIEDDAAYSRGEGERGEFLAEAKPFASIPAARTVVSMRERMEGSSSIT